MPVLEDAMIIWADGSTATTTTKLTEIVDGRCIEDGHNQFIQLGGRSGRSDAMNAVKLSASFQKSRRSCQSTRGFASHSRSS